MGEELKRAIKSPQMWASLIVCFITLMGYSLGSLIGCNIEKVHCSFRLVASFLVVL